MKLLSPISASSRAWPSRLCKRCLLRAATSRPQRLPGGSSAPAAKAGKRRARACRRSLRPPVTAAAAGAAGSESGSGGICNGDLSRCDEPQFARGGEGQPLHTERRALSNAPRPPRRPLGRARPPRMPPGARSETGCMPPVPCGGGGVRAAAIACCPRLPQLASRRRKGLPWPRRGGAKAVVPAIAITNLRSPAAPRRSANWQPCSLSLTGPGPGHRRQSGPAADRLPALPPRAPAAAPTARRSADDPPAVASEPPRRRTRALTCSPAPAARLRLEGRGPCGIRRPARRSCGSPERRPRPSRSLCWPRAAGRGPGFDSGSCAVPPVEPERARSESRRARCRLQRR